MSDADKTATNSDQARLRATRRNVIKGVIASGVAVSAVGYVVYERGAKRPAGVDVGVSPWMPFSLREKVPRGRMRERHSPCR